MASCFSCEKERVEGKIYCQECLDKLEQGTLEKGQNQGTVIVFDREYDPKTKRHYRPFSDGQNGFY